MTPFISFPSASYPTEKVNISLYAELQRCVSKCKICSPEYKFLLKSCWLVYKLILQIHTGVTCQLLLRQRTKLVKKGEDFFLNISTRNQSCLYLCSWRTVLVYFFNFIGSADMCGVEKEKYIRDLFLVTLTITSIPSAYFNQVFCHFQ